MNFFDVIEELVRERNLDRSVLHDIVQEGVLSAYEKKYPNHKLRVEIDAASGQANVFIHARVVTKVQNELEEISLKKARFIDKNINTDDLIWIPFEGKIGRVEVLYARQVIANRMRQVEAEVVYNQFKNRQGEIVHGIVHKCERAGIVVKIDDVMAFLPRSNMTSCDKCVVGYSIRALLKEVLPMPQHDSQLILDRASSDFVKTLFELEVPEIYDRLVEIKQVVRAPGYKTKIVVVSNDRNVDPVGTCIGFGGSRIKPILKEIGGERIDVLPFIDSVEDSVRNALKPAEIGKVLVVDGAVRVWLDDDQRSLAIGKMGKNILLASKLIDKNIELQGGDKSMINKERDDDLSLE